MFMTVQGYYNGNQIILDENVSLVYEQQVIVIILTDNLKKKPLDFAKYRAGKNGFPAIGIGNLCGLRCFLDQWQEALSMQRGKLHFGR